MRLQKVVLSMISIISTLLLAPVACRGAAIPSALTSSPYEQAGLRFESNQGQTDQQVRFLARGHGFQLFLTDEGATLTQPKASGKATAWNMRWVGTQPSATPTGDQALPGTVTYLHSDKHLSVASFAKVAVQNIYSGIDLTYGGDRNQIAFDFAVAPGADPEQIAMEVTGGEIKIDQKGDLVLDGGALHQPKPQLYQDTQGRRVAVQGHYVLVAHNKVGIRTGNYDRSKPLYIAQDLSVLAVTNNNGEDTAYFLALDAQGNIYVTGRTQTLAFPVTPRAYQGAYGGGSNDTYVAKLTPNASQLIYATYLGGNGAEFPFALALDAAGNAYVSGNTSSTNFPTTPGALQTSYRGGDTDAFLTVINSQGTGLIYSTYLGSSGTDKGYGVALDAAGNIYTSGYAGASDFPVTSGAYQKVYGGGASDAFVVKLNPAKQLVFSTFIGGSGTDIVFGMVGNSAGEMYLTGQAGSGFPVSTGQTVYGGGNGDAYALKLNAAGNSVLYSTYVGGSLIDAGYAIAVDTQGNAYITGQTQSSNFPTTTGAFQTGFGSNSLAPCTAGFVTKINPTGTSRVFSTLLFGANDQSQPAGSGGACTVAGTSTFGTTFLGYPKSRGNGIVVDSAQNIYIAGETQSIKFPTTPNAFQATSLVNGYKGFVVKMAPAGNALIYSTFLTGSTVTEAFPIVIDSSGNAYVGGRTQASDFPTTPGVVQPIFFSSIDGTITSDAFITKLNASGSAVIFSTYLGGPGP
jgi:Beta-propeller repeat